MCRDSDDGLESVRRVIALRALLAVVVRWWCCWMWFWKKRRRKRKAFLVVIWRMLVFRSFNGRC